MNESEYKTAGARRSLLCATLGLAMDFGTRLFDSKQLVRRAFNDVSGDLGSNRLVFECFFTVGWRKNSRIGSASAVIKFG